MMEITTNIIRYLVIASLYDGEENKGYRLINLDSYEVRDAKVEEIIAELQAYSMTLCNCRAFDSNGELVLARNNSNDKEDYKSFPKLRKADTGYEKIADESKPWVFVISYAKQRLYMHEIATVLVCDCLGRTGVLDWSDIGKLGWEHKAVVYGLGFDTKSYWVRRVSLNEHVKELHNEEACEYMQRSKLLGVPFIYLVDSINTPGKTAMLGVASENCSGEITIPDFVDEIKHSAFRDASSVTKVVLGKSVRWIGKEAFQTQGELEIHLNQGLEEIGQYAFAFNNITNEIRIPASVQRVDLEAFERIKASEIYIEDGALEDGREGVAWISHTTLMNSGIEHSVSVSEHEAIKILRHFSGRVVDGLDGKDDALYLLVARYSGHSMIERIQEARELHLDKEVKTLQMPIDQAEEVIQSMLIGRQRRGGKLIIRKAEETVK